MRIIKLLPILAFPALLASCHMNESARGNRELAEKEIGQAEKDFEKMAAEKGIAEAFWYFADSNATIKRGNDSLITGREGIKHFYSRPYFKTASVSWAPDFVQASSGADLGYTYGKYTWRSTDSSCHVNESSGIFHTVWKKQADGSWKYVWD